MHLESFSQRLFSIDNTNKFESLALEVFHFQSAGNIIYSEFIKGLGIDSSLVNEIKKIPFLPVEFFKSHKIITGEDAYEKIFSSSGTTSEVSAQHYVKDISLYEKVFTKAFTDFYGDPSEFVMLALLPSYLEREGSSLIYMMERLMKQSDKPLSGFYLHDVEKLFLTLNTLRENRQKTILFGVTYALLDFVSVYQMEFPELIVMETGGMKGKRKEMIREEIHSLLCSGFGVENIHSEYGMTELLSQAYSKGKGVFKTPSWMQISIRDTYDPFMDAGINANGGINIIDLANVNSCSFLSTQDLGKVYADGSFEILGRFDFSDVRGCNLMID